MLRLSLAASHPPLGAATPEPHCLGLCPPPRTFAKCPVITPNREAGQPGGGAGAASVTHSLPPRDRHTLVVTSATSQDAPRLQP